jgi:hypothetical protein
MGRIIAFVAVLSAAGCTAQQVYGSGQAWQRNQCAKIPDKAEYDRCMASVATTYEDYKRETEAGRR